MTKDARIYENAILISTIDKDEMWRREKNISAKGRGCLGVFLLEKRMPKKKKRASETWKCIRNLITELVGVVTVRIGGRTRHTTLCCMCANFSGKFESCGNYFDKLLRPVVDRFWEVKMVIFLGLWWRVCILSVSRLLDLNRFFNIVWSRFL